MSLATLQEFLDRFEAGLLFDLTLDRKVDADNPATNEEIAARSAKCQTALDDASAIILGYRSLVASRLWPDAELLRTHCVRLALHALTKRRIGDDYKTISEAAEAVIAFYEKLVERTEASGETEVTADAPPFAFNSTSLKGITE